MAPCLFVATKAFIEHDGKVLLIRETSHYADGTNTGRYDVPGGRVEPGQRFDVSLRREILEETGLDVDIGVPFHVGEWRPRVRGEDWQIVGIFFRCRARGTAVRLSADHDAYVWATPQECEQYGLIDNLASAFRAWQHL
jgi:8-oxo-dGTP diphosphatase